MHVMNRALEYPGDNQDKIKPLSVSHDLSYSLPAQLQEQGRYNQQPPSMRHSLYASRTNAGSPIARGCLYDTLAVWLFSVPYSKFAPRCSALPSAFVNDAPSSNVRSLSSRYVAARILYQLVSSSRTSTVHADGSSFGGSVNIHPVKQDQVRLHASNVWVRRKTNLCRPFAWCEITPTVTNSAEAPGFIHATHVHIGVYGNRLHYPQGSYSFLAAVKGNPSENCPLHRVMGPLRNTPVAPRGRGNQPR